MPTSTCLSWRMSLLVTATTTAATGWTVYLLFKIKQKQQHQQQQQQQETSTRNIDKNKNKKEEYAVPFDIVSMASDDMKQRVTLAIDLAIQAGSNMINYCNAKGTIHELNHNLDISYKTSNEDFCTKIDVDNERLVSHGILSTFPLDIIIGEETIGIGSIPPLSNQHNTWIIDPIDGTTNFAAGLPLSCVSIGYCQEGKPVMGIVYAPMTNELYVAVIGIGSYRNGIKISRHHQNSTNTTPITLRQALVCFELGYPRDQESVTKTVGAVQRIMEYGCRASRQLGSGVLDLCYVASGRLDAVYAGVLADGSDGWKPWDYCAGYVIQHEAGCTMEPIYYNDNNHQNDDGSRTTTTKEFDIYSKSHICAVSRELVQEIRNVITAESK